MTRIESGKKGGGIENELWTQENKMDIAKFVDASVH